MMYCIESGSQQQCSDCQLINGKLFTKYGYPYPNCSNTQWVQAQSYPGTNNTPVYQVVPMPLDNWILCAAIGAFGFIKIIKNRFI